MLIKKPENQWFKGIYYEYNKDQNKNNFVNNPDDYVADDDYNEFGVKTFGHEFRYKSFTDEKGNTFPIPGLKSEAKTFVIETSDSTIGFKVDDKIQFLNNEKFFRITNVSHNRKNAKTKATLLLPGLADVYNSSVVLTIS